MLAATVFTGRLSRVKVIFPGCRLKRVLLNLGDQTRVKGPRQLSRTVLV